MRRREFILGSMATMWPVVVRAKQAMPVIGFLHSASPEPNAERVAGFRKGLREAGFVEGQNVKIEYRWAAGQFARLPELASDLVHRQVAVITTLADTTAAFAAKAATQTIPIVFAVGGDPVTMGLVPSLSRPAGNITGVSILQVELTRKRLGLLRDAVPHANRFCALVNPKNAVGNSVRKEVETGAAALGLNIELFEVSTEADMESALAAIAGKPNSAFVSGTDAFLFSRRARLAELALQHKVPAVYDSRDYVRSGGLMSYGADIVRIFSSAGSYVARILKGEKPADLPIQQLDKFETAFNMKTANALGLEIPPKLLFTADEVIE
jgi:putative tryptophan/tyrosine transport system substrate-binding protein